MKNLLRPLLGGTLFLCAAWSSSAFAEDLITVYTRALEGNPEYQSAVAGYQQALEAKPQALAKLLPQIGLNGDAAVVNQSLNGRFFVGANPQLPGGTDVDRDDSFNSVGYQLGLTQVLFDRGLYLSLDSAELEVSRAGLLTYDAQDQLRVGIVEAYFAALAADEDVRYATAEKSAIEAVLAQTRDKVASGIVADAELKTALAQLDLVEAGLIAARNAVSVSRAQLSLLIGGADIGPLKPLSTSYLPAPPEPNQIGVWIERAATQNLQVKAGKLGVELARKTLDKAHGLRWPRLNASAAYTYDYAQGGISNGIGAEGHRATDERVGIQLRVPIYSGGAVSSGVRAALAGVTRAEADEAVKRNEASRKVQVAFLNSSAGIARVHALKQAIDSARASEEATRVGYEVGTRTNGELLLSLRSRYKAERDFAMARFDSIINTLRLRAAAGSLSHADLLGINSALQ